MTDLLDIIIEALKTFEKTPKLLDAVTEYVKCRAQAEKELALRRRGRWTWHFGGVEENEMP